VMGSLRNSGKASLLDHNWNDALGEHCSDGIVRVRGAREKRSMERLAPVLWKGLIPPKG
jgi:hypothetical protein